MSTKSRGEIDAAVRAVGWMPIKEAAARAAILLNRMRSWVRQGRVSACTVHGRRYVRWDEVQATMWQHDPIAAHLLELDRAAKCVVCQEIIDLGRETCRDCESLRKT